MTYPDKEQQNLINQTFGCCRFVYNMGLKARSDGYKNGEQIGYAQTSKMMTELAIGSVKLGKQCNQSLWTLV